jgi:hypothetical protein
MDNGSNLTKSGLEWEVLNSWWKKDIFNARHNFFNSFVFETNESGRVHLLEKCCQTPAKTKEILNGKTHKDVMIICAYHDVIGYLDATDQIDADNIIPAILHSMRKTWLAMAAFVSLIRAPRPNGEYFDPIFMCGFEHLFIKSQGATRYKLPSEWYKESFGGCRLISFSTLDEELKTIENDFNNKIKQQNIEAGFTETIPY